MRILTGLRNAADAVAAGMLAAMFAVFLMQIAARYVFNLPVGWTVEVCLTLWLWLVLWGAGFCLHDRDHVKFDLLYLAARPGTRRLFAGLSALAILVGIAAALPATWDYVDFYKIKRSATLRIPLKWIFIIYIAFCAALMLRYGWRLWRILRDPARAGL
ncbi:MAG: TRAP transporter small permease [Gemmobacter sp.]